LNPAIQNRSGHKMVGLLQFAPGTLKGLGYKDHWKTFLDVDAETQLDYVKKYINSKIRFSGRPFKSAAEFYVSVLWPVDLRLPGIIAGDPNTRFIENNPQVITAPNGKKCSKKYYDIGICIDPAYESKAYKANYLFHGQAKDAITYKDMMNQVDKNKRNPVYAKALNNMKNATGYQTSEDTNTQYQVATKANIKQDLTFNGFLERLNGLLKKFVVASNSNKYLISVGSSGKYADTVEYARI